MSTRCPRWLPLAAAALGPAAALAAPAPPEELPVAIAVPAGERLVLEAHATGVQIYVCAVSAEAAQWTLKAPEAELRDAKGAPVIRHFAGPDWKHEDGSEITGKAVARADSPEHSIPWLLLAVIGHSGAGTLAHVTHVQRIHTRGGLAPAAESCDADKRDAEVRVPYSADYLFYAPQAR